MSLIPRFYLDPWDLHSHWRNWDNFGLGIISAEIESLLDFPRISFNDFDHFAKDVKPTIVGKDGFQACINVKHFKPSEVTVKTTENSVMIEGKHEERHDGKGFVCRQFIRRYDIPKGFDPNRVISTLSPEGILTVKAPTPRATLEASSRVVPIQKTGPVRLSIR